MQAQVDAFWEEFLAEEEASRPGDVRATTLEELKLKPKQEYLYLFDYGDEWRFKVRVHAIDEHVDPEAEYPRLVESVGESPPQYPESQALGSPINRAFLTRCQCRPSLLTAWAM